MPSCACKLNTLHAIPRVQCSMSAAMPHTALPASPAKQGALVQILQAGGDDEGDDEESGVHAITSICLLIKILLPGLTSPDLPHTSSRSFVAHATPLQPVILRLSIRISSELGTPPSSRWCRLIVEHEPAPAEPRLTALPDGS